MKITSNSRHQRSVPTVTVKTRTKLQISVLSKARRRLKKYSWYNGVCLDMLPTTDEEIWKLRPYHVVSAIVFDTWFYDGQFSKVEQ